MSLNTHTRSVNERGLYDYLIINDNLEDAIQKLRAIAARALQGLEPEPGKVPESVLIEDVSGGMSQCMCMCQCLCECLLLIRKAWNLTEPGKVPENMLIKDAIGGMVCAPVSNAREC
jgi:hypothetical protein